MAAEKAALSKFGPFTGLYGGVISKMRKYEPKIGADGRIYFKYNPGAVFELRPAVHAPFCYKILSCEFEDGDEYYRVESGGVELPTRLSLGQLEFILGRLPRELLDEGEPCELPLLPQEVEEYFGAKRKEINILNAAANKRLEGTDYYKNAAAIRTLTDRLRLAKSHGDTQKVTELTAALAKLDGEQFVILKEKNVDVNVLTKATACKVCGDTGIKDGKICACALAIADKIKLYNVEVRRAETEKV